MKDNEIIDKLRQVKQTAEKDLSDSEETKSEVVQNVNYYGTITLQRREEEKSDNFELYTVEVYDYETDEITNKIYLNGQEVDMGELLKTYKDLNPIKDAINKAKEQEEIGEESEKYDLNEIEKKQAFEKYSEITGKKEEDIKEINEIDLTNDEKEEQEEEIDLTQNQANQLSRGEETKLNQQIKGTTLRNLLHLDGDYVTLAIVSSEQVNKFTNPEKMHSNIDSFVAIKANGEATVLGEDVLSPDRQEGVNSTAKDLTANADGTIDYESNRSSYKIGGTNFYLKVGYDENHGKEIKIEDRAPGKGDEGIVYELETSKTYRVDSDARNMRREGNGQYAANKAMDKQKGHEDVGCENDRVENIDDNNNNNTHEHFKITKNTMVPGKDITFEEWAEELGEGTDKLIERFERETKKTSKYEEPEKIAQDIEEDYENINHIHEHNH